MEDTKQTREEFKQVLEIKGLSPITLENTLRYFNLLPEAPFSQHEIFSFIKRYNNYAVRALLRGYIKYLKKENELIVPKISGRKKRKIPKVLSPEEVKMFLKGIPNTRDRLLFTLLFETGRRVSAILHIKPVNIDYDRRSIQGLDKENKEFLAYMTKKTFEELKKYIDNEGVRIDKYIFASPCAPERPIRRQWVWKLAKRYGIKTLGKKVNNHIFRHSCATFLESQGLRGEALRIYMGWSPSTYAEMKETYIHLAPESIENKVKNILDKEIITEDKKEENQGSQ